MRILVTGATGFVGQHLLGALRDANISEIFGTAKSGGDVHGSMGLDLEKPDEILTVVRALRPTHIVHLAAIPTIAEVRSNPSLAWNVNVLATLNLARAAAMYARGCTFIYSSSSEVYGATATSGSPLRETDLLRPLNEYAATKAAADLALGALASEDLRVVRMRPFNHTGPGQAPNFVVPSFAQQVARIECGLQSPIINVGNLDVCRDFLDVRDVVRAYICAIQRSEFLESGIVLNIGSGRAWRIRDVLAELLRRSHVEIKIYCDPAKARKADLPIMVCDSSRAKEAIHWSPIWHFERTLDDILQFQRKKAALEKSSTP